MRRSTRPTQFHTCRGDSVIIVASDAANGSSEAQGPRAAWRIDTIIARRGLHHLCLCSPHASEALATHFGKFFDRTECSAGELDSEFEYIERQAAIAATVWHPNLLPLTAHHLAVVQPLLVFPKLQLVSIEGWLAEQSQAPARPALLWYARQLLETLDALHRHGYVHGNVRPEHILLRPDNSLLLVGLGGCEEVGALTSLPRRETAYDAPETVAKEFEASSAQDIYAAAIVIAELLGGPLAKSPLLSAMRSPAANDRPSAAELVRLFLALENELFGQQIRLPQAA